MDGFDVLLTLFTQKTQYPWNLGAIQYRKQLWITYSYSCTLLLVQYTYIKHLGSTVGNNIANQSYPK